MVVIAVSGKPGCGSSTTAQLLARKLKLKYFSIGKYQKSFGQGKSETERSQNAWAAKQGELKKFEHEKDELSRALAKEGNVVVEGKLAVHMLFELADFKVWLTAKDEIRAKRYAERDKSSIEKARKLLKEKERDERTNWQNVYGFDYFSQEQEADISIDTGDKTPDEIVGLIINGIKEKNKN